MKDTMLTGSWKARLSQGCTMSTWYRFAQFCVSRTFLLTTVFPASTIFYAYLERPGTHEVAVIESRPCLLSAYVNTTATSLFSCLMHSTQANNGHVRCLSPWIESSKFERRSSAAIAGGRICAVSGVFHRANPHKNQAPAMTGSPGHMACHFYERSDFWTLIN